MKVTITVTDIGQDGKVEIFCDTPAPLGNDACEVSRIIAWYMLYAAEKTLLDTPVKRAEFRPF
jgi:hypothetical protein